MNVKKICIIGCGKVGSAFATELSILGYDINFIIDTHIEQLRDLSAIPGDARLSATLDGEFISASDIIIISVQDKKISDTVREIAKLNVDLAGKIFFHTSGSETSSVFTDAGIDKDMSASFHPIQTFMELSMENKQLLSNIYFGLEGGEYAINIATEMVSALKSKCIIIPKDKKQLYHTACVVSSNFLVTLLNVAAEFSSSVGIDKSEMFNVFRPIIEKTIFNISESGLVNSLTGPFERNDVQTISKHLDSISGELPNLIPFYTLLGMETVRVAFRKESLNMKNVMSILDLMNEYVIKEQTITEALSKE
jgi:predicted short-subunit dehydrogenase-like oxidoreductase (DUF2520 family)